MQQFVGNNPSGMSNFTSVVFFLLFVQVISENDEFGRLVKRIHNESGSSTVCFIGFENDFLSHFMRAHLDISIMVFKHSFSGNERNFDENTIVVVKMTIYSEKYTQSLRRLLRSPRYYKFIVIFTEKVETLMHYITDLTKKKYTRIFGMADKTAYHYLPYADVAVQELFPTDSLLDPFKDFNGFEFRAVAQEDYPRTFWYRNNQGVRRIGGCLGRLFENFIHHHNGTFKDINVGKKNFLSKGENLRALENNEVDISMNGFGIRESPDDFSYPAKIVNWIIVTPVNGVVDPQEYFWKPLTRPMLSLIGLFFVYFVCADVLKDFCLQVRIDGWRSFSRIFLAMLGMSNGTIIRSGYRFYSQVLVFAFFITNIYFIFFKSFLTVFIQIRQFETIQDLVDNNLRVMMGDPDWEYLKNDCPSGFERIVEIVSFATLHKELFSMTNTNFGYAVGADRGKFLIEIQKLSRTPLFRILPEEITSYIVAFPEAPNSQFGELLKMFIIRVMETGLIGKWDSDSVIEGYKAKLGVDENYGEGSSSGPKVLTLRHMKAAWECLGVGYFSALVAFVIEISIRRGLKFIERQRNKRRTTRRWKLQIFQAFKS